MRMQYKILMFILCLNLASYLVIALGLPGYSYVSYGGGDISATGIEEQFNPQNIASGWNVETTFLIGDVISAFNFFVRNFMLLIDGFPALLDWFAHTFITDAAGQAAFNVIAMALRAVFAVLMTTLLIEFIGGRIMSD